jgi:hypothetical protein
MINDRTEKAILAAAASLAAHTVLLEQILSSVQVSEQHLNQLLVELQPIKKRSGK